MHLTELVERFESISPAAVMARVAFEHCFSDEQLDLIFQENAEAQNQGELLFSTVVNIHQVAVLNARSSVNSAYEQSKKCGQISVSVNSLYNKLAGVETQVSRALVQQTGKRSRECLRLMGGIQPKVEGYRTKIADGKHLNATERRLEPLREINGAPLPGKLLAVLDADAGVVIDAIPSEDGHASERSLMGELLKIIEEYDLLIADRHFCTVRMIKGIMDQDAAFIFRRHGNLSLTPLGKRQRRGKCGKGKVYEQRVRAGSGARAVTLRKIEIELKEPTRDGDMVIVLLTNLPSRVLAHRVAELYRDRWEIEMGFQAIADALRGEIETLAYPKAGILGFCLALATFNAFALVKSAIATATKRKRAHVSDYYIAEELRSDYGGMMIACPAKYWHDTYGSRTAKDVTYELRRIAENVSPWQYRKKTRSRNGPPPSVGPKTNRPHVSTKRELERARARNC